MPCSLDGQMFVVPNCAQANNPSQRLALVPPGGAGQIVAVTQPSRAHSPGTTPLMLMDQPAAAPMPEPVVEAPPPVGIVAPAPEAVVVPPETLPACDGEAKSEIAEHIEEMQMLLNSPVAQGGNNHALEGEPAAHLKKNPHHTQSAQVLE